MNKYLLSIVALVLVMSLVFGAVACAKPAPAPKSTPAPTVTVTATPSPTPAPPAKVYSWRMQAYDPFTLYSSQRQLAFGKTVFERTGGRLKIDVYPPGTFGYSGFEMQRVVGQGLLEMATMLSTGVTELPVLDVFTHYLFTRPEVLKKAWDVTGEDINKALETIGVRVLGPHTAASVGWVAKKPLRTADEFKGAKLRAWNPLLTEWIKRMGGSPLVIPYGELYTSLATGVIEGNAGGAQVAIDLKLYEVAKYYSVWPQQLVLYIDVVNTKSFNELPADLKAILVEEAKKSADDIWAFYINIDKAQENLIAQKGVEVVRPAETELAKARKIEKDLFTEWYTQQKPDVKALMDKVIQAIDYKLQ